MQLIKYRRRDGQIVNVWISNARGLLDGHVANDDADFGYLFRDEAIESPWELLERYVIQEARIQAKQQVVIVVEPEVFLADGKDLCLLGVAPPVDCTLLVNEQPYALTADEPLVTFTSTTVQTFLVRLDIHPALWALPVMVSAIEEESL